MLWMKALHIIFMVTWFGGLFYLPRLFVYHALTNDTISNERFKIMERKLFYGIATPGAILTIFFGIGLVSLNPEAYIKSTWFHLKLTCVLLLIFYHIYLAVLLTKFKNDINIHSAKFYRIINEIPVIFLAAIVILVTVKPFG